MIFYILIICVILLLLFICFLFFKYKIIEKSNIENKIIEKSNIEDKIIEKSNIEDNIWKKLLFASNYKQNINLLPSYDKITYCNKSINIIFDGEPHDLSHQKSDLIISTKKEKLPKDVNVIYLPLFVFSFIEKNIKPEILIKHKDEKILKEKFCCFMYSNCDENMDGVKNRKLFLDLINKKSHNRVDNLGKCYNDNYKPNGGWVSNDEIYKPYKFVIAFENQSIKGYITEKLIMPMIARAIPIYLGAPDVSDYFNTKSFINVNDFPDFETCIEYILRVDSDENLYNSILREPYFYNNKIDYDLFSLIYGGKFYHDLYKNLSLYELKDYILPHMFFNNNIRFLTDSNDIGKDAKERNFYNEVIIENDINIEKHLRQLKAGDFLVVSNKKIEDIKYIKNLYFIVDKQNLVRDDGIILIKKI